MVVRIQEKNKTREVTKYKAGVGLTITSGGQGGPCSECDLEPRPEGAIQISARRLFQEERSSLLNEQGQKPGEKWTGSRLLSEFKFSDLSAGGVDGRDSRR